MPPAERGPGAPVTTCLGLRRNTTHVVKRELKTGTLGEDHRYPRTSPHHGSRTSSTEAFVTAVHPKLAIFTVGYRNSFGHPRPEIVARYAAVGSRLLRSDDSGAIVVKLDERGIHETAWRQAARRYWYDN